MNKKTVSDIDVKNKRVLVRVDFNVPLSSKDPAAEIVVTDDTRIQAAMPTVRYLLDNNAVLILCSHLGRPASAADKQYAMNPVAKRLSEILELPVKKLDAVVGPEVTQAVEAAKSGDVLLLENTRFEPGEKKNDPQLAAQLAEMADVYVNDAFGSAHRAHASTEGVAQVMKQKGAPVVAGFLMAKEIDALSLAVEDPQHPYVAIMGGAKISDKIMLIGNLLKKADTLLIGGGMANTFLKAQGYQIGKSLVEDEAVPEAKKLLEAAGDRITLPVDVVVADAVDEEANAVNVPIAAVPEDKMILDIGLVTIQHFNSVIQGAKLIVWNGPMGVFEVQCFSAGTTALATILSGLTKRGATVIVGGGDSAAAVNKAGLAGNMTHVSTGGGASLEFLEGKTLPGIAALDDK
jgi:phosphoglycerate kinase